MAMIALDPTPYHGRARLVAFPDLAARLGYRHLHLTPHPDFCPFYRYPKADDALAGALRRAAASAGVTIAALLPVHRISWPEEPQRQAAVRNFKRAVQLAVGLGVSVINTEFSGRPERSEDSEAAFYRSMEELLPLIEHEGITLNFDPHPDDFVEDALEAWRVVRALNSPQAGMVYVAAHTFHYGDQSATLLPEVGERLGAVYVADSLDHRRSHGLRYITNPPGNPARVHQHLKIGDGDVNWGALFHTLADIGFLRRDDALIISNVFAEDETADEVSRYQLDTIRKLIEEASPAVPSPLSKPETE